MYDPGDEQPEPDVKPSGVAHTNPLFQADPPVGETPAPQPPGKEGAD